MSKWLKCLVESASFALLRPRIKWGSKNSTLQMVSFTLMVSMVLSGFFVTNAGKHIMSSVSAPIKKNQLDGPFCVPLK